MSVYGGGHTTRLMATCKSHVGLCILLLAAGVFFIYLSQIPEQNGTEVEKVLWEQVKEKAVVKDYNPVIPMDHDDTHASHSRMKRKVVASDDYLWPNATITYTFQAKLARRKTVVVAIMEAIKHWEDRTCIRFIHKTKRQIVAEGIDTSMKYVEFFRGKGCHSSVGRGRKPPVGPQLISIGPGCDYPEMLIHELGHLVGLWHEQARVDRDSHVITMWPNVKENRVNNFHKVSHMRLLTPYDVSSMMHYDLMTFSKNGGHTLIPIDHRLAFLIGYRQDLSFYDVVTANRLYQCAKNCKIESSVCKNEGYMDLNCSCVCPRGLAGRTCKQVITDKRCGGTVDVNGSVVLTSPSHPAPYPNMIRCTWLVQSPVNTTMTIEFLDIDIEQARQGTCRDSLEIRYTYLGVKNGPLYCGRDIKETLETKLNKALIHFSSNAVNSAKGFKISFTTKPAKNCQSNPCRHNGTCVENSYIGGYYCSCIPGWLGSECDVPIVDGGLSEWSGWSQCTATCGLQSRRRNCTNPAPHNGGKLCTGATYESQICGSHKRCRKAFRCSFGLASDPDTCDIYQDQNDDLDWFVRFGNTPSLNTGPTGGHTTGESSDAYFYLEASNGKAHQHATIWLPPMNVKLGLYCVQFFYHMFGEDIASLSVLRRWNRGQVSTLWQRSGAQGDVWHEANINLLLYRSIGLGFKATRGEAFTGDIAIDDLSVSPGACLIDDVGYKYGCRYGSRRYRVGPFSYFIGCTRINCFCNHDGHVDCPAWQRENICKHVQSIQPLVSGGWMDEESGNSTESDDQELEIQL